MLYESSADEQSSRASTPDELTPSLSTSGRQMAVRQDLCVSCIAAAAAAAVSTNQNETENPSSSDDSGPHQQQNSAPSYGEHHNTNVNS